MNDSRLYTYIILGTVMGVIIWRLLEHFSQIYSERLNANGNEGLANFVAVSPWLILISLLIFAVFTLFVKR